MYLIFKEKIDINSKKDCLLTIIFILFVLIAVYLGNMYTILVFIILYIFFIKILKDSFIGEFFEKTITKYAYFIRPFVIVYIMFYHPLYSQILFGVLPGNYVVKLHSTPYATLL